mgnify:CR=1 FL=1
MELPPCVEQTIEAPNPWLDGTKLSTNAGPCGLALAGLFRSIRGWGNRANRSISFPRRRGTLNWEVNLLRFTSAIQVALVAVPRKSPGQTPADPQHGSELLPLVYEELRKLAAAKLAQERPGQTLQPTALVHEAYLRLSAGKSPNQWDNRRHFLAAAGEAMRRILIDNARRRAAQRHGGAHQRVELGEPQMQIVEGRTIDLLELDEAISQLEAKSPRSAEVVKLRYFAGLTMSEIAEALELSVSTVERQWVFARTWLYAALADKD